MLDVATPNPAEPQGAGEVHPHPNATSNAWGEIPEALVRDPSVKEAELVLTAYRATFTKSYVMRERALRAAGLVRGAGLGKNAIRRTIAAMKARGTITRQVPRRGEHVEERLALDALATGYLRVWRWWFSAVLTLKAMAAWLFLQAGTGKGPVVWGREIRARFGWDPKTCGKVVGELDAFGLLGVNVDRNKGGAYRGVGYQAKVWEKRGNQKPGMGKTGQHTKDSPFTDNLPHESLGVGERVTERYYAPHASREDAPPFFDAREEELHGQKLEKPSAGERTAAEIHYSAIMDRTMLGWIDQHTLTEAVFDGGPYEEHLEAVCAMTDDADLRQRLLKAGDGRINRRLLGPEGLHSVRWLAATLVRAGSEEQEAVTPARALNAVLEAVWARIGGRQGQWLNSWELIGHRIAGRHYECGDEVEQVFAEANPLLGILVDNDPAKGLSAKLKRDASGLTAFIAEQAAEHGAATGAVGEIMRSVLARGLFGDIRSGAIKSWKYFEGPIADELHNRRLEAEGVRPGDLMGAHKRR